MPRQVRFFSHACIALEGEEETLLADPWLFGDVFNNSWTLHVPPDLNTIDFGRLRHIWLSHEHPDHMHMPSLRFIRERVEGPVTVYYRRQEDPVVRDRLAALGFKVVEIAPHETMVIADDIAVTLFPTNMDSALVVRLGDRIIVNQNDCSLNEEETRSRQ
jgi:UDP-MurNAc hydroxylase